MHPFQIFSSTTSHQPPTANRLLPNHHHHHPREHLISRYLPGPPSSSKPAKHRAAHRPHIQLSRHKQGLNKTTSNRPSHSSRCRHNQRQPPLLNPQPRPPWTHATIKDGLELNWPSIS